MWGATNERAGDNKSGNKAEAVVKHVAAVCLKLRNKVSHEYVCTNRMVFFRNLIPICLCIPWLVCSLPMYPKSASSAYLPLISLKRISKILQVCVAWEDLRRSERNPLRIIEIKRLRLPNAEIRRSDISRVVFGNCSA